MNDTNGRELKHGDYIYWEGDEEVPKGEYYLDGSKWDKLIMYDNSGIDAFPLRQGTIIDNAENRNARNVIRFAPAK